FVVADGNRIDALGWCAPASRPSGASTVSAWRITSGRAEALALAAVPGTAGSATGLYAGQAKRTTSSPWPAGRYVFRIDNANAVRLPDRRVAAAADAIPRQDTPDEHGDGADDAEGPAAPDGASVHVSPVPNRPRGGGRPRSGGCDTARRSRGRSPRRTGRGS